MSEVSVRGVATETWAARTIGDTGKYINGLAFKPTDWGDEGMPIIRIQNLTNPTKPLNKTTRAVDPTYVVNPGDILVSWSATLDAFIWDREPALLNQHIFKVVPDTSVVSKKFLFYTLKKAIAEMIKSEHLHGSTMKHINRGPFLAHKIEVPTLKEQDEIVAELEKQFSRLDEAVANLQRVKANLKRYKASVLKAAVEGRLVETEATLAREKRKEFEPAAALLQQAVRGRRLKAFSAPEQGFAALPEGWAWASVEQLAANDANSIGAGPFGTIFKAKDFRSEGVPIIFLRHVSPLKYLTHKPGFMGVGKWEELFRPYSVFGGELLITKLGEPPGVCAQYPIGIGPAMVTPDVIKLSVNSQMVSSEYLMYYFNSDPAKRFATGAAFGTTRTRLTLPLFREMPVPLPPLAEQTRIVAEVDRHLSIIREVETEVDTNLQRAQALRQVTLSKAFFA